MRLLSFWLQRRLRADGARVLEELRYHIGEGQPHPRKLRMQSGRTSSP
jgi:hypothetical protein